MSQRVLIVIPAYNEEKAIAGVLLGLRQAYPAYDRVVVNDGSKDRTAEVVDGLGEKQLRLPCNLGYGQALQTGLKYGLLRGYDIVVSFDADGQHRVEDIPAVVGALADGRADLVIGSRFSDNRPYTTPLDRRLGQLLFSFLTRPVVGQRIYDTSSGFKALSAAACRAIVQGSFMDFHLESIVLLSLLNFKIVEVPITVRERTSGRSMHSLASIFQYPLKTILLTVVAAMDAYLIRRTR